MEKYLLNEEATGGNNNDYNGTAAHLCSWAALVSRHNESAGKGNKRAAIVVAHVDFADRILPFNKKRNVCRLRRRLL
ncbi:hypothetical protein [Neobacillus citreus]|nr:hypothetical protein [Neobacillus citreus]